MLNQTAAGVGTIKWSREGIQAFPLKENFKRTGVALRTDIL